jgi:uncharacterized protein (DUF427 family)
VRVEFGGVTVADSTGALRVLETSHPPTIYVPPGDLAPGVLRPSRARGTFCEWKGWAVYHDLVVGDRVAEAVAWSYPEPTPGYEALTDHLSFYPGRVDESGQRLRCLLDDEEVTAQPGDLYGGWLSGDITGPVKGPPGTLGW